MQVTELCREVGSEQLKHLKWNISLAVEQLLNHGEEYLEASKHFIETGQSHNGKRYSFHSAIPA